MPFNGAGVFTIINTFVPGTTIFSSAMNANFSDIATGLTTVYGIATTAPRAVNNIMRRNGGLEIWQRGAGGAAVMTVNASTTAYTSDGWYLKTASNQASTVRQEPGLVDGSQWCARVQRNSGQTGTGGMTFGFPIDTDELYPMLGQFVLVSLTLRAGANWSPTSGDIAIALNVGTGTPVKFTAGYTGATVAATLTQPITTSSARYQFTTVVIIPTTTRQAELTLTWTPVGTASTNDYFEIDSVQLEVVPAATGYLASNFEPLNFEEQLAMCLRHYWKTFQYATKPAQNVGLLTGELQFTANSAGAVFNYGPYRFIAPMRITPTVNVTYNPAAANGNAYDLTAAVDCAVSALALTTVAGTFTILTDATTGVGDIIGIHFDQDAGI